VLVAGVLPLSHSSVPLTPTHVVAMVRAYRSAWDRFAQIEYARLAMEEDAQDDGTICASSLLPVQLQRLHAAALRGADKCPGFVLALHVPVCVLGLYVCVCPGGSMDHMEDVGGVAAWDEDDDALMGN